MAGEHIEDLKLPLLNMDNKKIEQQCMFIPQNLRDNEIQQHLSKFMDPSIVQSIISDPKIQLQLK